MAWSESARKSAAFARRKHKHAGNKKMRRRLFLRLARSEKVGSAKRKEYIKTSRVFKEKKFRQRKSDVT